jgi:hypothetical protein
LDIIGVLILVMLAMVFGISISIIVDHEMSIKKMNRTLREIDAKLARDKKFEQEIEKRSISPPVKHSSDTGSIIDIVV